VLANDLHLAAMIATESDGGYEVVYPPEVV
jgi:hypothetical protein